MTLDKLKSSSFLSMIVSQLSQNFQSFMRGGLIQYLQPSLCTSTWARCLRNLVALNRKKQQSTLDNLFREIRDPDGGDNRKPDNSAFEHWVDYRAKQGWNDQFSTEALGAIIPPSPPSLSTAAANNVKAINLTAMDYLLTTQMEIMQLADFSVIGGVVKPSGEFAHFVDRTINPEFANSSNSSNIKSLDSRTFRALASARFLHIQDGGEGVFKDRVQSAAMMCHCAIIDDMQKQTQAEQLSQYPDRYLANDVRNALRKSYGYTESMFVKYAPIGLGNRREMNW